MPQLPDSLHSAPFRVRDGIDNGMTRKRLRGRDLDRTVWGVRGAAVEPDTAWDEFMHRCRLFATRMPSGTFFSHSTAALLHRAPLPLRLERSPTVHMSVAAPSRAPHAHGIAGHRLDIDHTSLSSIHNLAVTTPARTWCDLAAMLNVADLVAVGDFLIHWRRPLTSRDELARLTDELAGMRGVKKMRRALPLLHERAESRPESILRVLIEQSGLPKPAVNHAVAMTDGGRGIRTDLEFTEFGVILEYQGDYHRTKEQWRKDMTRRSRLEARGRVVMELNADDLRDRAELLTRIKNVMIRRGWRP